VIPVANASLTAIAGGGFTDDYDLDATADGTVRWSGDAPAYLVRRRDERARGRTSDIVVDEFLVVDDELGKLVQDGDTVTFEFETVTENRQVSLVQRHPVAGTCRLTFETT
jgi:hypothetical protein